MILMGITVRGVSGSKAKIKNLQQNATDLTPVWERWGSVVAQDTRQAFRTAGASHGNPWKPLTTAYARAKRRAGFGRRPLLVRSGGLRDDLTKRPMGIERITPTSAEFGSDLDTAVWHQKGTHRNGKRVNPPRPMLKLTEYSKGRLKEMITSHLLGKSAVVRESDWDDA